jgi:hypothetical protein
MPIGVCIKTGIGEAIAATGGAWVTQITHQWF